MVELKLKPVSEYVERANCCGKCFEKPNTMKLHSSVRPQVQHRKSPYSWKGLVLEPPNCTLKEKENLINHSSKNKIKIPSIAQKKKNQCWLASFVYNDLFRSFGEISAEKNITACCHNFLKFKCS